MTISSQNRTAGPFAGNDATTVFPFNFKVFADKDVLAVCTSAIASVDLVLTQDYTVALNADQDDKPGGSVTLLAPLATGSELVLTSQLEYLQPLDLTNQGGFYPAVINSAFDRVTIFAQQLYAIASRSLRFPLSDIGTNTELPQRSTRTNKLLGFDADGNPVAIVPAAGSAASVLNELGGAQGVALVGNAVDKRVLAQSTGASTVGFKQAGAGATDRTVEAKAREWVSILDHGGSPDGVTGNTATLATLYAAGFRRIHFPAGGANNYKFDGSLSSEYSTDMVWDVDPGVTISVLDIGFLSPSLTFARDTEIYLSALKSRYQIGPTVRRQPASRPFFPAYSDRDTGTLTPVLCNADLAFKSVTYNTDNFAAFVPGTVNAAGVVITTTGANDYKAGYRKVRPGDEISAQFVGATGGATPLAMVRTASSYYGLAVANGDAAQPAILSKASGGPPSASNITYLGMGTHSSYAGYKSLWSIRINSVKNFSVLYNEYEVQQVTTNDEIIEVGFGAQGPAGATMTIQDWTLGQGRPQTGKKSISIAVFGDSITDKNLYGNWPEQMVAMLDQHHGLRVLYLDNYAHSGDSSAAQLALCTPDNIARADVVLIMDGVNDIQGGVSENDYANNLTSKINICSAAGKRVIVGTPTMFYSQGQAGAGVGQATTNYDQGKGVRAKCLRVCADLGIKHVDTLGVLGPILADWVNPALSTVANLGRDPVVFDNIHPTLMGRMLLARAFASAVAGQIMPNPTLRTNVVPLPAANLAGGWTFTNQPGHWVRDEAGIVTLSGIIDKGAAIVDGTVIYTMPENIRPLKTARFAAWCDAGIGRVQIDAGTGQVSIFAFPAGGSWASLDGMSYPTK